MYIVECTSVCSILNCPVHAAVVPKAREIMKYEKPGVEHPWFRTLLGKLYLYAPQLMGYSCKRNQNIPNELNKR